MMTRFLRVLDLAMWAFWLPVVWVAFGTFDSGYRDGATISAISVVLAAVCLLGVRACAYISTGSAKIWGRDNG